MTTAETKKLFGKNLKYYRLLKRFTQTRVAYEMSCQGCHVARWEMGLVVPELNTMVILAFLLDIEVWQFFFKLDDREYNDVFSSRMNTKGLKGRGYRRKHGIYVWIEDRRGKYGI